MNTAVDNGELSIRPPKGERVWRICAILLLIGVGLGGSLLLGLTLQPHPAAFLYPRSVALPLNPNLGYYGSYETSDSLAVVADWYAQHGLPATPIALNGSGMMGTGPLPKQVSIPGTDRSILLGYWIHYLAWLENGKTRIVLACYPECTPQDPPWAGINLH